MANLSKEQAREHMVVNYVFENNHQRKYFKDNGQYEQRTEAVSDNVTKEIQIYTTPDPERTSRYQNAQGYSIIYTMTDPIDGLTYQWVQGEGALKALRDTDQWVLVESE